VPGSRSRDGNGHASGDGAFSRKPGAPQG
jgi:hypothetical protein